MTEKHRFEDSTARIRSNRSAGGSGERKKEPFAGGAGTYEGRESGLPPTRRLLCFALEDSTITPEGGVMKKSRKLGNNRRPRDRLQIRRPRVRVTAGFLRGYSAIAILGQ